MKNKGISLIVLVITILVIIVLAGAVILTMVTNNPLDKANEGIFKSDVKTFAQELSISMSNAILNSKDPKQINAWNGGSKADGTDMLEYITSMKNKQKYLDILEVQSGELVYIGIDQKEMKWAEEAGIEAANAEIKITGIEISNIGINGATIKVNVNKPSAVKEYKLSTDNGVTYPHTQTTNSFNVTGLTANTLYNLKVQVVDKKDAKIEKADTLSTVGYVPTGFSHTEGNVNTGFVIKDSTNGNEFVWIPVPDITKLVKYPNIQSGEYTTTAVDVELNNTSDANAVAMKASITKYKGFYRSRYEIGNEAGVPVSKKGVTVWTNITWTEGLDQARKMYNTSEVATDLIYGSQWDYICLWLKDAGYNITDSRGWGNHKDYNGPTLENGISSGMINKTGSSENWKANNIYDMAGNVYEWTQESQSAGFRYGRGGLYASNGSNGPVSCSFYVSETGSGSSVGFAVSLYKK